MARNLTEQQQLFLEVLFDEAGGDVVTAKHMAGYAKTYPTSQLVKVLEEEIIEATKRFLARSGPKAAKAVVGVMDSPTDLGNKERLMAAKDILDRIGVSKSDNIQLGQNGIFILPAKRVENE
jgi:hypothetical protein